MNKWIFVNNITSFEKLYILTKAVRDEYVNKKNHAKVLMEALNKNGANRNEANNHPLNYVLFYKMVEEEDDEYKITTYGKYILDNYELLKSNKFIRALFFYKVLYDIKYPNEAVETDFSYDIYPFRIIFKLLNDNRLNNRISINEFESLLSFAHKESDYEKLVSIIINARNGQLTENIETIAQASTVIGGWTNQFNVLKKDGEFIMISDELKSLLPEIILRNNNNFNVPFSKEFINYVVYNYLVNGKSMVVIENEYYKTNDRRGFVVKDVLDYLGINSENNKGMYKDTDLNKIIEFLKIQPKDKYKLIGMILENDFKEIPESNNIIEETKSDEYEEYTKNDFLEEVFIDENKYDSIVSILSKKKNIILEGAPGVGKTFMAKRLAYSIIGKKDSSKIKLIQFHQSYSYEDFIEGFRPTETGFKLEKGLFYDFCKKAEADNKNKYYLIIDEINRGNLSKIFGELLMLIEADKRGETLSLAYSEADFSIPENLYIIGLMNTADRSLALIDYALRRRFSFIRIEPAFDNEKFNVAFKEKFDNNYNNVIEIIKKINEAIEHDKSLGVGFQIGHSYFCPQLKDKKGTKKDIEDIIRYEIIPLLEEYWYDDEDSLIQWENALTGVIEND